jgi:flagellar basal-body rod modification protein FlgD
MNIPSIGSGSSSTQATNDALNNLQMDDFLQLMITELQNQDPLSPMDNAQLLQQISQIREIAASSSMTETLQAVLFGQSISNASSLIGKEVKALNDAGDPITGGVEKVAIAEGEVKVYVGDHVVSLNNVSEILAG